MTQTDLKTATELYKRYKCDTREYRELAAKYGMNSGELNRICWQWFHDQRKVK